MYLYYLLDIELLLIRKHLLSTCIVLTVPTETGNDDSPQETMFTSATKGEGGYVFIPLCLSICLSVCHTIFGPSFQAMVLNYLFFCICR